MLHPEPPWPDVVECFGHRHPSDKPGGVCGQCDGGHTHAWRGRTIPGTLRTDYRCTKCGAHRCATAACLERRRHLGPHLDFDGRRIDE